MSVVDNRVVCVLVTYWIERIPNIAEIVSDVLSGDVVPRKVLVINNNSTWKLSDQTDEIFKDERVALIDSDTNFTSRAKYAVALLEPADYYLLLDDDISVNPGLLARFMKYAKPGCCYSNWGMRFRSNHASDGEQIKAVELDYDGDPVPVDGFIGIVQFVSWRAIVKMLAVEEEVRLPYLPDFRSVAEDILIAQAQGPSGAHVLAFNGMDAPKFMHLGTEAMQGDWGYYQIRDEFSYMARPHTGHEQMDGHPIPGVESYDRKAIDYYKDVVRKREKVYGKGAET